MTGVEFLDERGPPIPRRDRVWVRSSWRDDGINVVRPGRHNRHDHCSKNPTSAKGDRRAKRWLNLQRDRPCQSLDPLPPNDAATTATVDARPIRDPMTLRRGSGSRRQTRVRRGCTAGIFFAIASALAAFEGAMDDMKRPALKG